MPNRKKTEWTPPDAGPEFTTHVLDAQTTSLPNNNISTFPKKDYTVQDYVDGIINQNRMMLSKAITIIESNADKHFDLAQSILTAILPYTGNSVRIGITGIPGAGKSTFIESFGLYLLKQNKKLAVLAVDPSSTITNGSILGDKTRMEKLSRHDNTYIRPSPSACNLGGVTRKTRETLLLCEAAGYDVIIIETVGVGQSEVTVRQMVDFFCLILIAGAGDELQGIKKGIIELADLILVNKADGDNVLRAENAANLYNNTLHYLTSVTKGWQSKAFTCSSIENIGIENVGEVIKSFINSTQKSNFFYERRLLQTKDWFDSMLNDEIIKKFFKNEQVKQKVNQVIQDILNNKITPVIGVQKLVSN